MTETLFVRPEVEKTRAARGRGWLVATLPPDIEADAAKRIQWFTGVTLALGVFGLTTSEIFPSIQIAPRAIRYPVYLPVLVLSAVLFVLARRGALSAAGLIRLSIAYKIIGAAGIAAMTNATPWPKDTMLPGWSPVAVWVLVFPMIVPAPTAVTFASGVVAALLEPAAIWLCIRVGAIEAPAPEQLARRLIPTAIALVMSGFVSRMIYRLGRKLSQARELGSYQLVERLGGGGMGEVWRARHSMLARPAAVKLIRPAELGAGPEALDHMRKRFEREAQATAALRSPHTVDIFDFGVAQDDTFYYVMELLDGMDLEQLVKLDGPQPPGRVVRLLRHACHSLREAHAAGMVHRDIKPANLFVCRYGADLDFLKVLDFGLVAERKREAAPDALTAENAITGTPAFMAPEMVVGDRPVDGRADLYALGCVAYWLLTGALVFDAPTAMKMVLRHATEAPVPPSARAGRPVPAELESIVLDCLEKDPSRRPRSARELDARLAALGLEASWTEQHAASWWESLAPMSRVESARGPVDAFG